MLSTIASSQRRLITLSKHTMSTTSYTHDFAVIGGGSGGLAAAKEASRFGAKVVMFDFVSPSPNGTKWGFGGTCVNVGCIPKKLFHYSSLLGESIHDLKHLGWDKAIKSDSGHPEHDWSSLVDTVTNYIRKLNFSYRTGARTAGVEYINAKARFGDNEHTIVYELKGDTKSISAQHVLVSVGGRPTLPGAIKGIEHAITSDDIFYSKKSPGKTLVVGGGYIAMECAGFLTGMGYPTTVVVRSRPLRNFDHQVADKIQTVMHEMGTNFLIGKNPTELTKSSAQIVVAFDDGSTDSFDTVLIATGRTPETGHLNIPKNLHVDQKSGKLVAHAQTNLVEGSECVYAVGDCLMGSLELTPVAIRDGELLAKRLFGGSPNSFFDKAHIPTTVFTPSEYGSVGLSEEQAVAQYGESNIESYLYEWPSLERAAVHREKPETRRADDADIEQGNNCFTKLVCLKSEQDRVVGFHFVGPNAGEVTQGFALAVKLGAKKSDFDSLVGIHPTDAEALVALSVTKSSGENYVATGGCGGGKCG
jgi:thioredoxin reductase (NADPH)